MSEFSLELANSQPITAEKPDYPLNVRPTDLQFGDVIVLPPDSDRPEGTSLILEGWHKREDGIVDVDGVLISDHDSPGSTESFGVPLSVKVVEHMTVDEITDRVSSIGFMRSVDKPRIKSNIQEMQVEFDAEHQLGS